MKRFTISVLSVVLATVLMAGCKPAATELPVVPTEEPQAQWKVILEQKVEQPVRMAAFFDETFGVTGGSDDRGKAHYTTDGGQTWTLAEGSRG